MARIPHGRTELVVGTGEGARLDVLVADRLGISRSRAARLIEEGRVTVNGEEPRKRDRPAEGDRIAVDVPPPAPSPLLPEDIPLDIAYEDADLLVVNKASGMVVHPAPGHRSGTLVNALLHRVTDLSGIGGVLRPGIVHRLDRDTSGLMVVAKHDEAHRVLSAALKAREVRREYLAACWGHLPEERMTVDAPIGRHPRDRKRMAVVEHGRRARTRFRLLERWPAAELLRVLGQVGEMLHARLVGLSRHADGVLGALEVLDHTLDVARGHVLSNHLALRRQPEAERGIRVLLGQGLEHDGHGCRGHVRVITQLAEQPGRGFRLGGDTRPVHLNEVDRVTFGGLLGHGQRCGHQGRCCSQSGQNGLSHGYTPSFSKWWASVGPAVMRSRCIASLASDFDCSFNQGQTIPAFPLV